MSAAGSAASTSSGPGHRVSPSVRLCRCTETIKFARMSILKWHSEFGYLIRDVKARFIHYGWNYDKTYKKFRKLIINENKYTYHGFVAFFVSGLRRCG